MADAVIPDGDGATVGEHDGLAHVRLMVELERDLYDSWRTSVPLDLDAGSLDHLARDVSSFIEGLEFGRDERSAETSQLTFEE
jgi:hypothetical protein